MKLIHTHKSRIKTRGKQRAREDTVDANNKQKK